MLCLRGVLEASNSRGAEILAPSTREPTPRAALVSLRNLPPLHFVGYLTKQGHRVKNWKRRWVSLTEGGSLSYSEEKGDAKGKGAVRLAHAPLPRAQKSSCLPMSQAARLSIRTPQDSAARPHSSTVSPVKHRIGEHHAAARGALPSRPRVLCRE